MKHQGEAHRALWISRQVRALSTESSLDEAIIAIIEHTTKPEPKRLNTNGPLHMNTPIQTREALGNRSACNTFNTQQSSVSAGVIISLLTSLSLMFRRRNIRRHRTVQV